MAKVSDQAVIIGTGETRIGRHPGVSSVQLQAQAVLNALDNCGLTIRDVDGLVNLDPYITPSSMFASNLAGYLGVKPSFSVTVDVGGTVTGMTMLQQAIWAVTSGYCKTAVCVFGENSLTTRAPGGHGFVMRSQLGTEEWEDPFGLQGMVAPYALIAQRYMHDYGATVEDFGAVAVTHRKHAMLNENAVMRKPMTLEQHRDSRMICSPLRLLDCSVVVDGAGAIVVTSAENARRRGDKAVAVRALGMRATHNGALIPDIEKFGMAGAAAEAFASAGMGPQDMDVVAIHDAFTVSVLVAMEAIGFAKPGEAAKLFHDGKASLGGACPVNTHGGLLSQGHVGGMMHLVEAARQLRGDTGARQVENARRALVSGNGGVFAVSGVAILERV